MRDLEFNIRGQDRTGPAFDSATTKAKAFDTQIKAMATTYAVLETAAKGFIAGVALEGIANLGGAIRQTLTQAADLVDLADKVGVATDDLQRMQVGFEIAGVAAGDLDNILSQWSKRIGQAYTNGGRLAEILKANGVSLTDSEGRLRSSVDLMKDYADLIANAASDQERMTLATEAFGKSGDAMVLALRDGADGMNKLMGAVDNVGGAFDENLLRRAADLDDQLNALWADFERNGKRAILEISVPLGEMVVSLNGMFREYEKNLNAVNAGAQMGAMFGSLPEATKGRRLPSPLEQHFTGAFNGTGYSSDIAASNKALEDSLLANRPRLRDEYLRKTGQHTVIPSTEKDKVSRASAARAAKEQESAYDRVIQKLADEYAMVGKSEIAQRTLMEQRRAGVDATSEQGRAIEALVKKIDEEERALEAIRDASDFMDDSLKQMFSDLIPDIETGNRALDGFINRIIQAAAEAALFGSGPFGGLFGGVGLFGSSSSGTGFRAAGGPVDPYGNYVVGENGPEILKMGAFGGTVISNEDAFGGQGAGGGLVFSPSYQIDARGADAAAVARLEAGLTKTNRELEARILAVVKAAPGKNIKFR